MTTCGFAETRRPLVFRGIINIEFLSFLGILKADGYRFEKKYIKVYN